MKMFYGNTPINSLNVHCYELSTQDATVQPSDLQAGITCYARGAKVTGTGKSFEFAFYGGVSSNDALYIPTDINVVEITSLSYPIQHTVALSDMKEYNFSTEQTIGNIIADGISYPVTVIASENMLTISCDIDTTLQIFYGKDNYV